MRFLYFSPENRGSVKAFPGDWQYGGLKVAAVYF